MAAIRRLAVTALIGLVCGCVPPPAASPSAPSSIVPPTASTAANGSQAPTAPATHAPSTGLGDTWERIELPGERSEPVASVDGNSGLVIVGRQCIGATAHRCTQTASAWHSDDNGATWQLATVEDADNTFLREVIYDGSYIAFGVRYERGGEQRRAVGILWQSGDGSDWQRFGTIELGDCTEEGCPSAIGLHANEGGPFLFERVLTSLFGGPGPPYRSTDGNDWTLIPAEEFGLVHDADVIVTDAIDTSPGFYALLTGRDLPLTAWASVDGATWSPAGSFDEVTDTSASVTFGAELVVARSCQTGSCGTSIWVESQGGGFEGMDAPLPLTETRVTFTGPTGYLLVGLEQEVPRAFTSLDARTWEPANPGPPGAHCGMGWLAGGPSLAIFMGQLGCGEAWITRGVASD